MPDDNNLPRYQVYALRYATREGRRQDNFIGGDPHDGPMPMDYFCWLAISDERRFVIDCGFTEEVSAQRKRTYLRNPVDALELLGVRAADVEDVIITHLHYDHAGNLPLFPRALFHLQDAEMTFATGRHMAHPFFSHAYDLEAVLTMVRLTYGARVRFHTGDAEVLPGVSVHHVGGHTLGLQVVRVWTRLGWMVLASDATHYLENMNSGRPFPIVADITQMISGWQRLHQLASAPQYIIPGHDPLVMQRYPEAGPTLRGIAVRLDVEPRELP